MIEQIPSIAARFNLEKVGTEQNCWQVFWSVVRPENIAGSALYEGSIHGDDYYIALQHADPAVVDLVRSALIKCDEFGLVCLSPPFMEGDEVIALPLPRSGRVDANGNLIGDDRRLLETESDKKGTEHEAVYVDVLESASTYRVKPASPRTEDLPAVATLNQVQVLLKERFVSRQPGYEREIWISPKELCDVVEEYSSLVSVGLSLHSSERSENALRIRLFSKHNPGQKPIELEGMYMFKSRQALSVFLQSFNASPKYADALPDLAGILGRFQLHFTEPANREAADYSKEEDLSPEELWPKLLEIREGFGDELNRAVDTLRARRRADLSAASSDDQLRPDPNVKTVVEDDVEVPEDVLEDLRRKREKEKARQEAENEHRRQEVLRETETQNRRRSDSRCIFCGKPLGLAEKLKKVDRHRDCWEYVSD